MVSQFGIISRICDKLVFWILLLNYQYAIFKRVIVEQREVWKRLYTEEAKKPRHLQGISNSPSRCPVHLEGISTKLAGASRSGARCSKVPPSWNSWVESFKTGVIRKVGSSAKKLRSQEAKAPLLCKLQHNAASPPGASWSCEGCTDGTLWELAVETRWMAVGS